MHARNERLLKKYKFQLSKKPVNLLRCDGKRPDRTKEIDVVDITVSDTFAKSHLTTEQGMAAKQVADNKTADYEELEKTHIFPVAIETASNASLPSLRTTEKPSSCFRRCAKGKCGLILWHSARVICHCSQLHLVLVFKFATLR